ncbi:hypothetical protein J6590_101104 [Homalodisca vitripennis]|nr:hypothetical protein J6590_101104 [Homalodisca vitripennis]
MFAGMEDLCTTQWQLHLSSRPHWRRLLTRHPNVCWYGKRSLHNTVATSPEFQASLEKAAPQDIRM